MEFYLVHVMVAAPIKAAMIVLKVELDWYSRKGLHYKINQMVEVIWIVTEASGLELRDS